MAKLTKILKEMDREYGDFMLLDDGAHDWSPSRLLEALRTADEPDHADYVVGSLEDGRITITRLKDDGYRESAPKFTQLWHAPPMISRELEDTLNFAVDKVAAKDRRN